MTIQKREGKEFKVIEISNGFLFRYNGYDKDDNWTEEILYVPDIDSLVHAIDSWVCMEES